MRILRVLTTAAILSLLIAVPSMCAVNSISLQSATDLGLTGSATAITGSFGGTSPHTRVEINAKMNTMPTADHVYVGWLVDDKNNVKQSLGVFKGDRLMSDVALTNWSPGSTWNSFAVSLEPANSTNPGPTTIVATGSLPGTTIAAGDYDRMAVLPSDEAYQRDHIASQYNLTTDQVISLRNMGLGYSDINLAGNISKQTNQPITRVAETYMREGGDMDRTAAALGTTVTAMTSVEPSTRVAGSVQEVREPGSRIANSSRYGRSYPSASPVLSYDQWKSYSKLGYSWVDVAAAANISSLNGDNMDSLLRTTRVTGSFWHDVAADRGLDSGRVLDVSGWTWERAGRSFSVSGSEMRRLNSTAGTMMLPGTGVSSRTYNTDTSSPSDSEESF